MILCLLAALAIGPSATRFSVVNEGGFWWLEGPDQNPFFSLGVCCVTTGESYLEDDPNNPAYAAYRYYSTGRQAWADDTVARLQSWKFNTIGAWSDAKTLRQSDAPQLKFTPILHMGSGAGAPWRDMWDPQIVKNMDAIARDQIKELRGEKRVIGYFSDNEQGWWYGALFDWAWKSSNTRKKLVEVLQSRYPDWMSLQKDFDAVSASSYDELKAGGRLYLRPGGHGFAAVDAYMGILADRYYSLCRTIIKHYDPAALYLGDRYISNFYPSVARAAGKYADVVSTNLNADWNDGSFSPFYLSSLHRIAKKPLLISEYYMCANQNRTGDRNDSSGFPVCETQVERAKGFLTTTNSLLATPYVVGAHWFQYFDEPKNGRGDGEDYNMGLVDVYNQPYDELTQAAASLDLQNRKADVQKVSATIPRLATTLKPDLNNWPRQDAYWAPDKPSDRGDAFVTWTPDALYVAVRWDEDRFAESFYRSGKVPVVDQPLLSLAGQGWEGKVRFIENRPLVYGPAAVESFKMGVKNTAILRLPSSSFGLKKLVPGMKLRLSFVLRTRARAFTVRWSGVKQLSD